MRVYGKAKVCDLLSGPIHRFKDAKSALWLASLAACLKVSTKGQIQFAPLCKNLDEEDVLHHNCQISGKAINIRTYASFFVEDWLNMANVQPSIASTY